eukprot:CAMPEP_0206572084 /NCGR_PEP_ID=MMETSP0325_2-20121206/28026_1 /ASSEMBLY_ACC=CAM_ASM_000347 /TAXON_ID=2866 /ORGANISM="Crypthecodinium cohnii, Strain Seligo" /LENGTH=221 /DNA_ID=CAMNT_0054076203 /DNA_START=73 /DNA_END=738 /DNA_ORIENTATION=-
MMPRALLATARGFQRSVPHRSFNSVATKEQDVQKAVESVFKLFERQGQGDYVGEAVSQIEHGLQAADLAAKSGFGPEEVLAALLHDVGHLLGLEMGDKVGRMDDCGIVNHEALGGEWLSQLGFSEKVANLVTRHVDAKRYLCFSQPGYYDNLSYASKTTLGFQGGPMLEEEATKFKGDERFKTIIAMRHWDEAAKVPGKEVPPLEAYRGLMESHLRKQPSE